MRCYKIQMKGYKAAERWGITVIQVQILSKENRIPEAQRVSRI